MGVHGLWQLLHPAGKPVSPASLEGKVLAVDVSIWLHQTMKGMRDKDGNPLPNAHLQGLFSRICKLLFYCIRPIFVFDGGVPTLKKQTLAARRERKENVDREKGRTSQKILQNLLRSHAVRDVTGDRTEHISVPPSDRPAEQDLFQLPPLPKVDRGSTDPIENAGAWEAEADEAVYHALYQSYENDFQNLDDIDFESEEFESLPAEIRHEILSEMKEQRRENALARIAIMPEESEDFSDYQLKKLIKQSRLSGKIESLRKEMNQKVSGDISYALGDNYYGEVVEARRVASEDAAHYILIKGLTRKQQIAEAERCKARRLMKEERRLERNPDKVNLSLETVEEMGEEFFSDSDEVDVKVDAGSAGGRILSDDETSDEKEQQKSRRERRGKALVTRDGLRSVAKKGKRKPRVKCLTISDDEEDVKCLTVSDDEEGVKCLTVSDDEKDDVPVMDKDVAADGRKKGKGKSTKNKMALDDNKEDELLLQGKCKPEHGEDDLHVEGKSVSDHNEDDPLVEGKSVSDHDEKDLLVEGKSKSFHKADGLLVEGKSTSDHKEDDTAVARVTRDQTNQSALTRVDAGKSDPSKQTLQSSLLSKEAYSGVDSLFQGTYSGVDSLFQGTEQKPNTEVNTPENQTEKTLDPPTALQTVEESHFVETRNRLLTEEEDLMKAKEAKMAALMKSLVKRTQAVGSPPADRNSPAEEELSTQDTRKKLLQQEEELMKEKEVKMAALLKSVEKRSQLQSQSGQSSLKPEKGTSPKRNGPDQDSSEDEAEQASHGFLEDVVDLERQAILRKSRTRSANQAAPVRSKSSSSSTSSKPLPFPALTVDYLEDVDAMLEIKQDSSEICTALNETDRNNDPVQPTMTTATQETSDKAEEGRPEVSKLVKATAVGEGHVKPGPVKGKVPLQDSMLGTGGFPSSRTGKRVASERLEEKATKKQARVVSPPARTLRNNAEDSEDEGFIEITIDPTKVPEDDLFPASIFVTEPVADENPTQTGSSMSLQKRRASSNKNNSGDDDDDDDVQGILPSGLHQRHLNVSDVEEDGCVAGMKQAMGSRSGHQRSIESGEVAAPSASVVAEMQEVADGKEQGNVSMGSIENEEMNNFTKGVNSLADLYDLQQNLSSERQALTLERGRQARLGKSITEQINLEAQELLRLFGVPYVVSPMEAESQCAHLEMLGLTQGTITDDSDAWLFGAQNIYKNFFNQTKFVEFYSADAVYHRFGLDRRKLINLALLCGSDYTPGIPGVGPVRAMEVLAEFPGKGLEGLRAFREWWEDAKEGILPRYQGKLKSKLRTLQLHEGFPSRQVMEAYLNPAVDESEERFTWGLPDLQLLRQYAKQKFGWGREKVDNVLEPMMKELTKKMTQGRIHSYFQPENFQPPKPVQSKRLQKALDKFQNRGSSESESQSTSGSESEDSEPALPNQGENIKKANQILSGSTKGRGRGSGSLRGKRGGKSDGLKGEVKGQSARGRGQSVASVSCRRGRDRRPAPLPKQLLVRDEVCLSESSSSSDDSLPEKPSTKKPRTLLPGKTAAATQLHAKQQGAKPAAQKASSTKKKPSSALKTNVRNPTLPASRPAPGSKRKSEVGVRGRKAVGAAGNEVAAFKEAMGGDLDPMTMTIDDLGSDFSEDDFNV